MCPAGNGCLWAKKPQSSWMAPSWMFPDGVMHPPGDPGGKSIRVGSSSRGMRRAATGWTGAPRPTGRPARPVPVAVAVVVVGRPVVVVVVGRPGAPAPAEAVVVGAVEVVIREEAPAPEAWVVDGPAAAAGPREPEPKPDPLPEPLATAVVTPVGGSAPPKPARGPKRWRRRQGRLGGCRRLRLTYARGARVITRKGARCHQTKNFLSLDIVRSRSTSWYTQG